MNTPPRSPAEDLLAFAANRKFGTILADPPWRFQNRTGKVAPEHRRLSRYGTMTFADIEALPVPQLAAPVSHLYLWRTDRRNPTYPRAATSRV
jgi:N6-adenosine-specific RNA methylase IME4